MLGECVDAREPLRIRNGLPATTMTTSDVSASDACTTEGARACSRDSDIQPLLCVGGAWQLEPACSGAGRCDRTASVSHGDCVDSAPQCAALSPGALFCSAEGKMLECIDGELARTKLCGDNQHCVDAQPQVRCACTPGFVPSAQGCVEATDCAGGGGCDPLTQCIIENNARSCTACPPGYSGKGDEGCAPLLSDLIASPGQLDPPFDPNHHEYRVVLPALVDRVSLTAHSSADAELQINAVSAKLGAPWQSEMLTDSVTPLAISIRAKSGARNDYQVLVQHAIGGQTYLKGNNSQSGDHFGEYVAAYGNTVVVGAPFERGSKQTPEPGGSLSDAGAAYVFVEEGGHWRQQAYLKSPSIGAEDYFGIVSIWKDTIVVGAPGSVLASWTPGTPNGTVHIFERTGDIWEHKQAITSDRRAGGDGFGYFVQATDGAIMVGAPLDDDGGSRSGAAYLFTQKNGKWEQQLRFKATQPTPEARFGHTFSMHKDTVAIAAWGEPVNDLMRVGAVYIYTRTPTGWSLLQRLTEPTVSEWAQFGMSVSLLEDTLVVSAPHNAVETASNASGAAYVYKRRATEFELVTRLEADRPTTGDYYGSCTALSATQLLVGAPVDANSNLGSGAAYLYTRSGDDFLKAAYLTAAHGDAQDRLGQNVALVDGYAVVSAPVEDSSSHAINEDDADNRAVDSGATYIFR